MIRTLAALALLIAAAYGRWDTGDLRVKWGILGFGTDVFLQIPQTKDDAITSGWVQYELPPLPSGYSDKGITMYCPNDEVLTVCPMFDDTDYVCGLNIALDKKWVSDEAYSWTDLGFNTWSATLQNGTVNEYWISQMFLASADFLAQDSEIRIANRKSTTLLQDENVWVTGFKGALYNISTNTDYIATSGDFTEQACIPFMGHHYYYKMTKDLQCSSETMFPYFAMVYSKQLVGVGFVGFTKYNAEKKYFEEASRLTVKLNVPRGPECLYDLADSPGIFTMHTYFIPTPRTMTCLIEDK